MSIHSHSPSVGSPTGSFIPTDRFEVDQYVRVILNNGRTEIGQVVEIGEDRIIVTTQQGYDVTVSPRNVKRAFLLVLDLNGVLVARGKGNFVLRPYVKEFMKFVFTNFAVAVWTSGLERSSNPIIESVFDDYQDRLLFKLYRDSCSPRPTISSPWGTVKDLQLIFSRFPKSFHSGNTIIVDDSPDKCSHPDIALCPVPFKDPALQADDVGLQRAISILQEVLMVDSHAPVIRAAEERLAAIHAGTYDPNQVAQSAAPLPLPDSANASADGGGAGSASCASPPAEVDLWKSRLCCENLRGQCTYGDKCAFSHDHDDGKRPCSRKSKCKHGHADRWVATDGDKLLAMKKMEQRRYADLSDAYYISKEDMRGAARPGRAHTGIPAEDARLEEVQRQARAPHAQATANAYPTSPLTFSTNPNRHINVGAQAAIPPHSPHHMNVPAPRNSHRGSEDRNRNAAAHPHSSPKARHRGNGQQTRAERGGRNGGVPDASYTTGAQPVPTGGAVRITANANDGTALLRQLHALAGQRK